MLQITERVRRFFADWNAALEEDRATRKKELSERSTEELIAMLADTNRVRVMSSRPPDGVTAQMSATEKLILEIIEERRKEERDPPQIGRVTSA